MREFPRLRPFSDGWTGGASRIRIGHGEGPIGIEQRPSGAARPEQELLMGVVQALDASLGCTQAAQSFLHARGAGLRGALRGIVRCAELRSAVALHLVDLGVEGPDFAAQILLVSDAALKAVEVKGDCVGASRKQGSGD